MNLPLPLPVDRALKKLGADLSLARRRRNLTQAMLAERLGTAGAQAQARPRGLVMTKIRLDVCIGKEGLPVGELAYVKDGAREYSAFAYAQDWLRQPSRFNVSPDLVLASGHQVRKPPAKDDSRFFLALADTEPDAWGRRV